MIEQTEPGYTLYHLDAARAVLVLLGYSISPSREPGADERAERVAAVLARYLQPNAVLTGPGNGECRDGSG